MIAHSLKRHTHTFRTLDSSNNVDCPPWESHAEKLAQEGFGSEGVSMEVQEGKRRLEVSVWVTECRRSMQQVYLGRVAKGMCICYGMGWDDVHTGEGTVPCIQEGSANAVGARAMGKGRTPWIMQWFAPRAGGRWKHKFPQSHGAPTRQFGQRLFCIAAHDTRTKMLKNTTQWGPKGT